MRRTLPALKLGRSPLALSLVEIRISPVLKMADHIPAIQDRLRKLGYPGYAASQLQTIVVAPMQEIIPEVQSSSRWLFTDQDKRTAAVVSQTGVVLETSAYDTFDDFVEKLSTILAVVGEEAEIAFSDRVGLRYVDVVRPTNGERLLDYLTAGVHGLDEESFGGRASVARSEFRSETDKGNLVIRVTRSTGPVPWPPDLQPVDIETPALAETESDVAVLDFDHFSAVNRDFVADVLVDALWDLHDNIDRAFRSAVTRVALDRWEAAEV